MICADEAEEIITKIAASTTEPFDNLTFRGLDPEIQQDIRNFIAPASFVHSNYKGKMVFKEAQKQINKFTASVTAGVFDKTKTGADACTAADGNTKSGC